ncbi:MAG: tyrosine-type recombinase/integrase [Candidatus Aquicultorales bacterium]
MAKKRTGVSIHKRGPSYYVVYRTPEGKQKWKKAGPSYKENALPLKTEIQKQLLTNGVYKEIKDTTFKGLAEKWLKLKKTKLRPKSYGSYEPMILRIVKGFDSEGKIVQEGDRKKKKIHDGFGDRNPKTIQQEEIEEFAARMLEALSPDLTKRTLTLFKAICAKGIQWSYLNSNPVEYVEKPESPKPEMDYLSPDEMERLIKSTDNRYKCLITFACLTGCRQSEILGLRWSDVDFASGKVHIRQVYHGGRFDKPKTEKSRRAVLISPRLMEELKTHQLRQTVELGSNAHNLVFPNLMGKPMDGHNLTRRILRPALTRAGIREIRFHDLRHSYISMLMNQGANIRFIQQQAGHSSAQITWDRYGHVYPETEQAAVLQAENAIFSSDG